MAGTSLLTLLDDIATVLDDVALMTKVAAKKTAGVLGDDLALNAQQVSGVRAEREWPVVWAVAKGSLKNKAILVPSALLLSAFAPWAVTPLLMIGGAYLCFEGVEKLVHYLQHRHKSPTPASDLPLVDSVQALPDSVPLALEQFEREKIQGAIRTDFILSAEIIVIALGTVQSAPFMTQVLVITGIAVLMTVGVYGLVAGIVKLDDAGLHLVKDQTASGWGQFKRWLGQSLVQIAPYLMKSLSVIGTVAMFLVGGGILAHGLPFMSSFMHPIEQLSHGSTGLGWLLAVLAPAGVHLLLGILAGGLVLAVVHQLQRFWPKPQPQPPA